MTGRDDCKERRDEEAPAKCCKEKRLQVSSAPTFFDSIQEKEIRVQSGRGARNAFVR